MPLKINQQIKHLSWEQVDTALKDLRDKINLKTTPKVVYVIENGDQVFGALLAEYLNIAFVDNRDGRSRNLLDDWDKGRVFFTLDNSRYNLAPDPDTTNAVFITYMNEDETVDYDLPDIYHEELIVPLDDIETRIVFPWQK